MNETEKKRKVHLGAKHVSRITVSSQQNDGRLIINLFFLKKQCKIISQLLSLHLSASITQRVTLLNNNESPQCYMFLDTKKYHIHPDGMKSRKTAAA